MATTDLTPMRKKTFHSLHRRINVLISAALVLLSESSHAAQWVIVPSIGLRETYSDNIALAPASSAKSEWVTELVPGISAQANGPRFKLNAIYAVHLLDYRNVTTPAPRSLHEGNVLANGEVIRNLFFVDAEASVTQQNILSFGPQSIDTINTTGNRTEVRTSRLSPYLRRNFGNFATAELRYTDQRTRTSDVDELNADSRRILFDLNSGLRFHTWGWDLLLDRQRIDYVKALPVEFNRYIGKLRYAISPRLSANLIAGHEDNNYSATDGERNGRVWALALSWAPSEITSVAASAGERFFGRTYSLLARHRSPMSTWTLGYNEDVTTLAGIGSTGTFDTVRFLNALASTNEFESTTQISTMNPLAGTSIPGAPVQQGLLDLFAPNTGLPGGLTSSIYGLSNRVYLQRLLQASVELRGARNRVLLRLYGTRREPLSTGMAPAILSPTTPPLLDDDTRQVGMGALWTMYLSSRTNLNVDASITHIHSYTDDRTDRDRIVRVSLIKRLQEKLSASIEVRHQQRTSTASNADYRENAVVLFMLMQF